MDELYTGGSDSDGGHGDDDVREFTGQIYQHVDDPTPEHKNVIRRVAGELSNINWTGLDIYICLRRYCTTWKLFNVLKSSENISSSSSIKSSSSCANMTTMSTSHTSATRQTTLANVPGSSDVQISENINASTFEDAFLRATCQPLTGPTLLDIFIQTGTSQKKCISTVPMQDYVVKLEIFP